MRRLVLTVWAGLAACGVGGAQGADEPSSEPGPPSQEEPGSSAPQDVDTLNAQEHEQFPTYILWWPTSWRVVNISQVEVPVELHCRNRSRHFSATLAPGAVAEDRWQCQGDPLTVKNHGTQSGVHVIEVSTW